MHKGTQRSLARQQDCPIYGKKQYQLLVEAKIVKKKRTKKVKAYMYVDKEFFESCENYQILELGNKVYPISHVHIGGREGKI